MSQSVLPMLWKRCRFFYLFLLDTIRDLQGYSEYYCFGAKLVLCEALKYFHAHRRAVERVQVPPGRPYRFFPVFFL